MFRAYWRAAQRRSLQSASIQLHPKFCSVWHASQYCRPKLTNPTLTTHVCSRRGTIIHQPGQLRSTSYQRFNANTSSARRLFGAWVARPTFYLEAGGLAITVSGIYLYNLEEVPVSGRRRFNLVGYEYEERMAQDEYAQILTQYRDRILPAWDNRTVQVRRVLERLIPASGLPDKHWEVHVIASEVPNAFVLPSGKVFVFTGILPICDGDQGLAAVLGHEIAHNVAHHAAERLTQVLLLILAAGLLEWATGISGSISQGALDFAFHKPRSRKQESEADYIGLMIMAQSCYNPEFAVQFWSRMEQYERGRAAQPEFLSTHPSSHNRGQQMLQWLPEATDRMNASGCGPFPGAINDFRVAVNDGQNSEDS